MDANTLRAKQNAYIKRSKAAVIEDIDEEIIIASEKGRRFIFYYLNVNDIPHVKSYYVNNGFKVDCDFDFKVNSAYLTISW